MEEPLLAENQTYQMNLEGNPNPELTAAFMNKAAFTRMDVPSGNLVYFSYPFYMQDQFYGVLRFTGDYTNLFTANERCYRVLEYWSFVYSLVFLSFPHYLRGKLLSRYCD